MRFIRDCERGSSFFTRPSDDESAAVFAPPPASDPSPHRCLAREAQHPGRARTLLAVQNPDGSLPFADWEVESAASHFPETHRTVLAGAAATKAAVLGALPSGEEKLLSTHGWFDIRNVANSHLVLHAGKLTLEEIVPLDLRGTWLAVMSACMTGMTDVQEAMDEYYGLSAAFLVAGAQTVVSSLWAVDDVATALLMQRVHRNLYKGGLEKASALREAQIWLRDLSAEEALALLEAKQRELMTSPRMAAVNARKALFQIRDRGAKPFAHPYWWAAFQCIGAGWAPVDR
jgi:CHAT domain-containing protein